MLCYQYVMHYDTNGFNVEKTLSAEEHYRSQIKGQHGI